MTVFDFTKDDQGDWFAFFNSRLDTTTGEIVYDPPEPEAAEFRIRSMGKFWEDRRKDRKKEYKMVLNPGNRQMERVGYYEDLPSDQAQKENEDAWDYAITGIRNAFSAPGVEIKCDRESKLKFIDEVPAFLRFITRVFQILSEAGVKQKEASEKN